MNIKVNQELNNLCKNMLMELFDNKSVKISNFGFGIIKSNFNHVYSKAEIYYDYDMFKIDVEDWEVLIKG